MIYVCAHAHEYQIESIFEMLTLYHHYYYYTDPDFSDYKDFVKEKIKLYFH